MAKREKKELYPTLKIKPKPKEDGSNDELSVEFAGEFVGMQGKIVSVKDQNTDNFGSKVVAVIESTTHESGKKFSVFVNGVSQNNLIDAFGDDDENWLGKVVTLEKQKDKKYKTEMIVLVPVK